MERRARSAVVLGGHGQSAPHNFFWRLHCEIRMPAEENWTLRVERM